MLLWCAICLLEKCKHSYKKQLLIVDISTVDILMYTWNIQIFLNVNSTSRPHKKKQNNFFTLKNFAYLRYSCSLLIVLFVVVSFILTWNSFFTWLPDYFIIFHTHKKNLITTMYLICSEQFSLKNVNWPVFRLFKIFLINAKNILHESTIQYLRIFIQLTKK